MQRWFKMQYELTINLGFNLVLIFFKKKNQTKNLKKLNFKKIKIVTFNPKI
jgi:hypothetical protein